MIVGLGIFLGLCLGEPAAGPQPVADLCIRLMQMTALPQSSAARSAALQADVPAGLA